MAERSFPPLFGLEDSDPIYKKWRSIVLSLFQSYKFNYEILGSKPGPEGPPDVHPYHFLEQLEYYQPREFYFGEKRHVHFNSYFAYGHPFTSYPMGESLAYHHFTLENYQYTWNEPLIKISNWQETFPLIFSTENNYFLECCNGTFLTDARYDRPQDYPLFCAEHDRLHTAEHFDRCGLPASLLLHSFAFRAGSISFPDDVIRTLNFCLKLFHSAGGVFFALQDVFGESPDPSRQIDHLNKEWDLAYPALKNSVGLYRLNLLSFLYLSLHPAATALCYGLYRNKYGVIHSHRTAFYLRFQGQVLALKDHLKTQIHAYLEACHDFALKEPNSPLLPEMRSKIVSVLDLGRMYGLGYSTNQEKGQNIHINSPIDLTPADLCPALAGINYRIEHDPRSPFWRIFYDYCGEWWSRDEILQVILGRGEQSDKLRSIPRNNAIRIFNKYAALFWRDEVDRLVSDQARKDNILNKVKLICD